MTVDAVAGDESMSQARNWWRCRKTRSLHGGSITDLLPIRVVIGEVGRGTGAVKAPSASDFHGWVMPLMGRDGGLGYRDGTVKRLDCGKDALETFMGKCWVNHGCSADRPALGTRSQSEACMVTEMMGVNEITEYVGKWRLSHGFSGNCIFSVSH